MLVINRLVSSIFTIIAGASLLAPAALYAQSSLLEEIIVTATMREESLQDVPLSIATLSSEDIRSIGAFRMQDLNRIIPNVNFSEGVIDNVITVRGVGSGQNQSFEQSVGVFRDGIYVGKPTLSRMPFLDLAGLEVVRGPQGVLFGRSTIAGAVTQRSNGPTENVEIGGRTQIALDEDQDYELEGYVSGPLSDSLRGRVAMRYRDSEGFVFNEGTGDRLPEREEYAVRGTLEWDINETITSTLKIEHTDTENNGPPMDAIAFVPGDLGGLGAALYGGLIDPDTTSLDYVTNITQLPDRAGPGGTDIGLADDFAGFVGTDRENTVQEADVQLFSLKLAAEVGDYSLESITGYAAYDQFFVADPGDPFPYVDNVQSEDYSQFSQEVRLLSPVEGRYNWVAGVYYESNDFDYTEEIDVAPFFAQKWATFFNSEEENVSVFGQLNYNITDTLSITGGVRYNHTEKDADIDVIIAELGTLTPAAMIRIPPPVVTPHAITGSRSEDRVDWMISLEKQFEWAGEHTAYFTFSKGSKAGGFNARSVQPEPPGVETGDIGAFEFEEEEADAFELGLKALWLNGTLQWNWAIYYTKFENLQASLFNGVAGFTVANAPETEVAGFETDLNWALSDSLGIWANLAYLDDEVSGFPPGRPGDGDLNGDPSGTPDWTGSAGFRFRKPVTAALDIIASATYSYKDSVIDGDPNFLERPQFHFDSEHVLDFQLGIGSNNGKWTVNLLGTNMTDEISCSFVGSAAFTDGALPVCTLNPPRTFYLQANYNY